MATWDDVRTLGSELPEVVESTSYGQPALRVRKKWFTGMSPHEEGALVVRVEREERSLMIEARPDVYYLTPHYEGHDLVLMRLDAADRDELRERLIDSWLAAAPKSLVDRVAVD